MSHLANKHVIILISSFYISYLLGTNSKNCYNLKYHRNFFFSLSKIQIDLSFTKQNSIVYLAGNNYMLQVHLIGHIYYVHNICKPNIYHHINSFNHPTSKKVKSLYNTIYLGNLYKTICREFFLTLKGII